MANTLADPSDLADFPGAPFTESIVDAAVGAIRAAARWHIAPVITETLVLDGNFGGPVLFLPTRLLLAVASVEDLTDPDTPVTLTGWRKSRAGMLSRACGWPCEFESIQVTGMQHGYAGTPPELLQVIAEYAVNARTNSSVRQETSGAESITWGAAGAITPTSRDILARYTIPVSRH